MSLIPDTLSHLTTGVSLPEYGGIKKNIMNKNYYLIHSMQRIVLVDYALVYLRIFCAYAFQATKPTGTLFFRCNK